MAGEKYIALEETSQEIKTALEGVRMDVDMANSNIGNGAGTDVMTRLEALAQSVTTLTENLGTLRNDVDTLKTLISAMGNAGGTKIKKITHTDISNSYSSEKFTITTASAANKTIVIPCVGSASHESSYCLDVDIAQNKVTVYAGFIDGTVTVIELE